jgi:hypothetical protein
MLSLVMAASVAVWGLVAAPLSWGVSDKLSAPGTVKGQETTVTVKADGDAGKFRRQSLEIFRNGTATCEGFELQGAIFAPVVGHIDFTTVDFGSCIYLGRRAHLNASSCDVVVTSAGLGKLTRRNGERCDLRLEIPGCTIHFGKGPFLELGYHNEGSPAETTALTEPVPIGGIAIGPACLLPGPSAIGQYSGYLRLAGSRNGMKQPFIVIV